MVQGNSRLIEVSNNNTLILMQQEKGTPKEEEGTVDEPKVEVIQEEVVEEVEERYGNIGQQPNQQLINSFASTPSLQNSGSFALVKEAAGSLEEMRAVASVLIKSELCPLKKESDVVLAIITGNQYGFPFMTSISNIYPIKGKPTLSAHLHRAILLKNKIVFNKVYDFEAVYQFAKLTEDGKAFELKDVPNPNGQGSTKQPTATTIGTIDTMPVGYAKVKEVDRITRYVFKRLLRQEDGSFEKLTVTSEFRMSDGAKAQLLEKENWIKYPARMLDARAFSTGAREIASDLLLGIYSISELADEANIKYSISPSLEESIEG